MYQPTKEKIKMTKQELIKQLKIRINHYFEADPWTGESNEFFDDCDTAQEALDDIVDIIASADDADEQ